MNILNILILLKRLWLHTSPIRRVQFRLLLILMLLASVAEIISIGLALPFLEILTNPARLYGQTRIQPIIKALGFTEPSQLLLPLTVTFCMAIIVAAILRLLLLWASTRLSFAAGHDLSVSIYRRTLYQPYAVHVARNSSEIIDGISNKTNNAVYLVNMTLNLISSTILLLVILFALLTIDLIVALATFGSFGLIYLFIIKLNSNHLLLNSQTVARESTRVIKSLQEGLGGIRHILIDGSQETYCQIYRNSDKQLRKAQRINTFISSSPRAVMEALAMLLIAILAYVLSIEANGMSRAVPVLGALALGAQRMLPVLQQAYGSFASLQGGQASLKDTLDLLDQPLPSFANKPDAEPIHFQEKISLKQLSFRYNTTEPWVLRNLNLDIEKGSRIGFVGVTGGGKSTLLDILMGLLQPTNGTIEIDGQVLTQGSQRAWQAQIAHVSQTIFLSDCTIGENIAFGVPHSQIDIERLSQVAKQAQISDIIEGLPQKYETVVGEGGVRLSGGQRQRIGIARALYKKANIIIFDEATSGLDNETEHAVMQAIDSLSKDLTILIIAHRLTSLKNCTQIVEIGQTCIKHIGTYQDMLASTNKFNFLTNRL